MKLSSAVPAVVAAFGAEVALAVPVTQDVSHSNFTSSEGSRRKALTDAVHFQDHVGTVAEAAGGALMDRNAVTEEASSIALRENDGSFTDKVCWLFLSSLYPPRRATLIAGSK